jgi:hypothetical protein
MELDIGVPSHSELKILKGLDCSSILLVGAVGGIDFGPKRSSTRVQARFVCSDMLLAVFLSVVWDLAENTDLLILIGVAAQSIASPIVGIASIGPLKDVFCRHCCWNFPC